MSTGNRRLLLVVFAMTLLAFGTIAWAAQRVVETQLITVRIQEADGLDLYLPIPAAVADLAFTLVPTAIPAEERARIRREMGDHGVMLEALMEELADAGDVTFVTVEDGSTHVRVAKSGSAFEITVDEPDTRVEIHVPSRIAEKAVRVFA